MALNNLRGWGSGGKVIIFKVCIPSEAALLPDELDQERGISFRYEGKIPPEWIEGYAILDKLAWADSRKRKYDFVSVKKSALNSIFYVPIVVTDRG